MNTQKVINQIEESILIHNLKNEALPDLFQSAHNDWEAAQKAIKQHGVVIEDERGSLKANPACQVSANAWSRMMRILEQCGLTPKAKKSNAPRPADDIDPIDEIPDL